MTRKIIETSNLSMIIKRLVTSKFHHYIDYYVVVGVFLLLLSSIVLSVTSVLAATSVTVDYKAQLTAKDGSPITLATTVQFSIYNHLTRGSAADTPTEGGPLLWTETYSADTFNGNDPCEKVAPDSNGNFSQRLGSCNPFPSYLTASKQYYLGVRVGIDSEATPRVPLSFTEAMSGEVPFVFGGATDNDFETSFVITDPTADNLIVFPDASGTVVLVSDEIGASSVFEVGQYGSFKAGVAVIIGPDAAFSFADGAGGDLQVGDELEVGGSGYIGGNLVVGANTAGFETLANAGFFLDGDDLFVAGSAGVESFIYSNDGLVVGASTTYADGDIESSGPLTINNSNNQAITMGTGLFTTGGNATISGDLTVNGSAITVNARGDLRFADSDSSHYVAFQAPATVPSNITWTLPAADGTSGQIIATDGSGILSWTTNSAGGLTDVDIVSPVAGNLLIYDGTDSWDNKALLGDATISSSGVLTIAADSIALATDTTGNYVATVADAGSGDITVSGSGSENAAVTLDITDDALDFTEFADAMTLDASTTLSTGANNLIFNLDSTGDFIIQDAGVAFVTFANDGSTTFANDIAVNGGDITSTGALTITPSAGNNLSVALSGTGDFIVNINDLVVDTSSGRVGLGTTTPASALHIIPGTAAALQIDPFGAAAGNTGEMRFLELAANGTNYVGFKAPDDTGASNTIWTLPAADGTNGQVLSTDGSAALSWADVSASLAGLTDTTIAAPASGHLLIYDGTDSWDNKALSGDVTVDNTGLTTIGADTVALTTDTTGNYVASITSGSGIAGGAAGSEGTALTLALGPLTADWNQTGAFDISLNNASSELRILESAGATYYGTLDVGDLSAARTYTFPDTTGTVALTSDIVSTLAGLTDTAVTAPASGNLLLYDGTDSWDNKALSGDATINSSGVLTIAANAVALTTDTTGNYVATLADAGSGDLTITNGSTEGGAATIDVTNDALDFTELADALTLDAATTIAAGANALTINLDSTGDFVIQDAGVAFATFADNGSITFDTSAGVLLDPHGVSAGNTTELRFLELAASGTNYVGFKSADTLAANVIWTLPNADGTSGQALTTDGSGALSWANGTVGADSLDFIDFEDNLDLDASTTIALGANQLIVNLDSTGDFVIQDAGVTFVTFADDGSVTISSSLTIPNGTSTSLTAEGQLAIDTDADGAGSNNPNALVNYNGTGQYALASEIKQVSFTITSDGNWDSEAVPVWRVPRDTTIDIVEMHADVLGTTTPTLTFNVEVRAPTTVNTAGSDLLLTDQIADGDGINLTALQNNSNVAATSHLVFTTGTSAESGTVDAITVTIWYRVDVN